MLRTLRTLKLRAIYALYVLTPAAFQYWHVTWLDPDTLTDFMRLFN